MRFMVPHRRTVLTDVLEVFARRYCRGGGQHLAKLQQQHAPLPSVMFVGAIDGSDDQSVRETHNTADLVDRLATVV